MITQKQIDARNAYITALEDDAIMPLRWYHGLRLAIEDADKEAKETENGITK